MAKLTKVGIYAKHGIKYDSKKNKIYWPHEKIWINELLKHGNSKTGKDVYTWSLPAGTEGSCVCNCKGCYAMNGFYLMPSVKKALALNLRIVEEDIGFFYHAISAQLEIIGSCELRIHAAGDFATKNSLAYALCWKWIAAENPAVLAWTYTKVKEYETLFADLPNGHIVKSVIDGIGVNYGHCDYILETYNKLVSMGASVWICRCGFDKNQHCHGCHHCATADFVLFLEHSTEYRAEQDPLYSDLYRLVMAQED